MDRSELPVLALFPGDCTGIGPEQTARILANGRMRDVARLVVVGDKRVLEMGKNQAGVAFETCLWDRPDEIDWTRNEQPVIDLGNIDPQQFQTGVMDPNSGRLTGESLAAIIEFAKSDEIDGLTFGPLNKQALFRGGWEYPDEHKMYAHLLGHDAPFGEMNVLENRWMSRVTSHVSLREAVDGVTFESICTGLSLADQTMRAAGFKRPRIAVAALNPHNGEGGLFGREEIDIIRPAVEKMSATGIACEGPFPADTVYLKAFAGDFDSVLAMYHDQGQIATKLRGFNKGVTVTAGLDIIFTTPAHGTAFDIAGKGIADTGAFEEAIRLAARIATHKRGDGARKAA